LFALLGLSDGGELVGGDDKWRVITCY
jgi:hypothetical protein